MLSLIEILVVLSGSTAAFAGPMRRYTNTTSQFSSSISTVAYDPPKGRVALSVSPIVVDGVTSLPFTLLAGEAATSDAFSLTSSLEASSSTATNAAAFSFQPLDPGTTASIENPRSTDLPTSFKTVGQEADATTVTVTSITWTTVYSSQEVAATHSSQQTDLQHNATASEMSHTAPFSFDPAPTESSSVTASETSATALSSIDGNLSSSTAEVVTSSFNNGITRTPSFSFDPLPTTSSIPNSEPAASDSDQPTDSAAAPTAHTLAKPPRGPLPGPVTGPFAPSLTGRSTVSSLPKFSLDLDHNAGLPEVVTESAPATQTSDSANVPGITIVPQNPSVIFITVTDAAATVTVSA